MKFRGPVKIHSIVLFTVVMSIGVFSCSTVFSASQNCYPLKSLKSISGETTFPNPKVIVGVIGSGIDYNHPGLARFLEIRKKLEAGLQQFEDSTDMKNLNACEYQQLQKKQNIGFPLWMDQALQSPWPMDNVYKNGILQPNEEHETRVASRIIERREDIALHFVRRMYGSEQDHFDVSRVIENFSASGVKIVNMSFGSACGVLPLEEYAWSQIFKLYPQIIFVISAGNAGRNLDYFDYCPAKYSRDNANVISVTSATQDGVISVNYDPEVGSDILMNYGMSVDLAIGADNLSVLVPLQYDDENLWINHSTGWTSHAAAEVTRVIAHAVADGYPVHPRTVKAQLISTSRKSRFLSEFVTSGGTVDEVEFRASFNRPSQKNY